MKSIQIIMAPKTFHESPESTMNERGAMKQISSEEPQNESEVASFDRLSVILMKVFARNYLRKPELSAEEFFAQIQKSFSQFPEHQKASFILGLLQEEKNVARVSELNFQKKHEDLQVFFRNSIQDTIKKA